MSSFVADKVVMDGLTYDDVLLIPAYSEVLPKTVELTTKFSRNIELKIPFVTAAMDTVTEAKMFPCRRIPGMPGCGQLVHHKGND